MRQTEVTKAVPLAVGESAIVGAAYFLFCLLVQASTGAWQASFVQYPDEPSHFVGAVMVRDWLLSGRWFAPLQFARNYYTHYPFFAVGYWPPAFHLLTGLEFAVIGVGRMQALLIPAAFASATAWLVFRLLRQRSDVVAAACAGTLYLSLPIVQKWMCAVMVDHMTACLCIASGVLLLRYLEQPSYRYGFLWAVLCGFAILSKYSAAYLLALPWATILLFRRGALLRKPSFLIQPVIVAAMVGPWAVWTRGLAFYGLPAVRPALSATRAASFVAQTFEIFPPVLMVVVILGLLVLLLLPKAWRKDLLVFGLLYAGHLLFLFISPVEAEPRYLLAPAASLLVLSLSGWAAVLPRMQSYRSYAGAVCASLAVLTIAFVLVYFGRYSRPPQPPIRQIVDTVLANKVWGGQRLVVPPDLEGPFIAEFVGQERHRPAGYLVRTSKILASSDWFGGDYSLRYRTPRQVLEYFRQNPVTLIIWHERSDQVQLPHERILSEMLRENPLVWHKAVSFDSAWAIYEYVPLREYKPGFGTY